VALGLLAANCGLIGGTHGWAQSPKSPPSWSSPGIPTGKLHPDANGKDEAYRKVIVDRIEFDRPVHLSDSDVEQIIKEENEMELHADSSAWVDDLAEVKLRSAWQDQGYFEINLDAQARSLGTDSDHERFLVVVQVKKEGPQFHLGNLQFTGGTAIPEAELRQVFPLREGEFFSVKQVRAGIEAITKLYGSHGYIDFTAVPDTKVDENLQRIELGMHLDEQKQFRFGTVKIQGIDPGLEAGLRSITVPNEIVNMVLITAFFEENRSVLPPRALDDLELRRNVRTGIADVTFDARSCPRPESN